ncbi:hypothetical protein SGPA1_11048 [Streptomyces misionensis JCM 4497]
MPWRIRGNRRMMEAGAMVMRRSPDACRAAGSTPARLYDRSGDPRRHGPVLRLRQAGTAPGAGARPGHSPVAADRDRRGGPAAARAPALARYRLRRAAGQPRPRAVVRRPVPDRRGQHARSALLVRAPPARRLPRRTGPAVRRARADLPRCVRRDADQCDGGQRHAGPLRRPGHGPVLADLVGLVDR